ncbi:MAG TPA: hypothetical protein VMS98_08400 [Thermoanaerobaculia bacterium]|nr:hypothetical protein [Thermoanaerobaculia bacterium]
MTDRDAQRIIDDEHLRLLRIGYLIAGITNAVWVFFPLIYVVMGLFMTGFAPPGEREARVVGLVFAGVGGLIALAIGTVAVLKLLTARALGQRRSRTLCMVTAAITCIGIPWGTALGVGTLIVLGRPGVAAMFARE